MAKSPKLLVAAIGVALTGTAQAATPVMTYDDVGPQAAAQAGNDGASANIISNSTVRGTDPITAAANANAAAYASNALASAATVGAPQTTGAKPILSYGDLSSLERPLAYSLGKATIIISGVLDVEGQHDFNRNYAFSPDDAGFAGAGQVEITQRLANRWTVGAIYYAQYTTGANVYNSVCGAYCNTYAGGHPHFNDYVSGYVRTSWGTFYGGNVGNLVRNDTRRRPGYGETALGGDDFLGQLARWGGGYQVRLGPVNATAVVDENGDFEVGSTYHRPFEEHDIRVSARFRQSQVAIADGLGNLKSDGVGAVGDLTYGSSIYDVGLGYEHMTGRGLDLDRWFVSSGARTKIGTLAMSIEGHYGQIDGSSEYAASAGLAYAIARGVTTNIGLNYEDANVVRGAIVVLKPSTASATASVRYTF